MGVKILIVDDNSNNLYLLDVLFRDAGYGVVMAKDGIDALEKLRADPFDGIVSDILMPVMDGFRLIRECKKDPALRQIPFIFYTATYTEKKDEEFGLSLGAIRYIIKPAEPEELLRQIREAFSDNARAPRNYAVQPVADDETFSRGYTQRVGAKLEKKERALQESEKKYRLLFEMARDSILLLDAEGEPPGKIIAANAAAAEMHGYSVKEILTKTAADLDAPSSAIPVSEWFRRINDGEWFRGEAMHVRKDGTVFPVETNAGLVDTGTKKYIMAIDRDITERRKAEELLRKSKVQLAYAMDLARLVNWEYDVASDMFTFNDPFYSLYGTTAELEGGYLISSQAHTSKFVYPEDVPRVIAAISDALATKDPDYSGSIEHRILRGDGEIRHIIARFTVIMDRTGKVARTHGANQDITERKKAEQALEQVTKKLSLLNSITFNDIQNSVFVLNGYLSLDRTKDDARENKNLNGEEESVGKIIKALNFAKNYQDLGVHPPKWQEVNLSFILGISHLDFLAINRKIQLDDLEIYADSLLERVFFTLADNILQHAKTATQVRIGYQFDGDSLILFLEDNGAGIPYALKEKIFERGFGKQKNMELFLVREILSITGITIRETGTPGKGARFEMNIPKGVYRFGPGK